MRGQDEREGVGRDRAGERAGQGTGAAGFRTEAQREPVAQHGRRAARRGEHEHRGGVETIVEHGRGDELDGRRGLARPGGAEHDGTAAGASIHDRTLRRIEHHRRDAERRRRGVERGHGVNGSRELRRAARPIEARAGRRCAHSEHADAGSGRRVR